MIPSTVDGGVAKLLGRDPRRLLDRGPPVA
jgi:hypothetical protein